MVTKLIGELRREIKVSGIDLPVVLTLTSEGVTAKVRGSKIGVSAPWAQIITVCSTPESAPGKLHGQPLNFLQDAARRIQASLIKRLDKERVIRGSAQ